MSFKTRPTREALVNAKVINDGKTYPYMPVCPQLAEAGFNGIRCDDPFCSNRRGGCAFKSHPRGRARWIALCNPELLNWSA